MESEPAFPQSLDSAGPFGGLTKREWFAGQALPSVMHLCAKDTLIPGETIEQAFARKSLDIADALIAALEPKT